MTISDPNKIHTDLLQYTAAVTTIENYINNTRHIFVLAQRVDPLRFQNVQETLAAALNTLKDSPDYYKDKVVSK